jgi:hypothetical protein
LVKVALNFILTCDGCEEKAMIIRVKSRVAALVVAVALCGSGGSATAACYAPDQQLPAQAVNNFLGKPDQILQDSKNAQGGSEMIALVRDLLASNPATLPLVIALLGNANPAQQTAIGTGLGQAAGLCIRPDPTFAADIQTELAGSTSENAKTAYAAVTGNRPIRSVAAGGAVSGGSSGGSTASILASSANSGFTPFNANSVLGTSKDYFTGGTSGATGSSSLATAATTSVSQ